MSPSVARRRRVFATIAGAAGLLGAATHPVAAAPARPDLRPTAAAVGTTTGPWLGIPGSRVPYSYTVAR